MSKLKFKNKQIRYRIDVEKKQYKIKIIKILKNDYRLPFNYIKDKINNKRNSISNLHGYCLISLRRRAIINKYRLSRMMFRKYGENKYLNGLKKSSW